MTRTLHLPCRLALKKPQSENNHAMWHQSGYALATRDTFMHTLNHRRRKAALTWLWLFLWAVGFPAVVLSITFLYLNWRLNALH